MAKVDDRQLGMGQIYARAILALADQQGQAESILEELEQLRELLDSRPELARMLASPLVDEEQRRDSLERLFRGRASDLLVDSLQVINDKGRLDGLPAIIEAYRREYRKLKNLVDVDVTSAVELPEALSERLRQVTDRLTGKQTRLITRVDPELLGGLVVRIDDQKIDSSVRSGLNRLSRSLTELASQQILRAREYVAEEA